jgi:hypothetical protein
LKRQISDLSASVLLPSESPGIDGLVKTPDGLYYVNAISNTLRFLASNTGMPVTLSQSASGALGTDSHVALWSDNQGNLVSSAANAASQVVAAGAFPELVVGDDSGTFWASRGPGDGPDQIWQLRSGNPPPVAMLAIPGQVSGISLTAASAFIGSWGRWVPCSTTPSGLCFEQLAPSFIDTIPTL